MYLFRRFPLLLIVWATVISTSPQARTPDEAPRQSLRLQVSLFNDAQVDPATLARAQSRASAIFAHSGIEVDWLVCAAADPGDFAPRRTACSTLSWPAHLSVRIRPGALSASADTFGQAFVDAGGEGVYSNVYYQNLSRSSRHPELSDAEMLGCVLAHELGHLLLGANSHSASGVMQARWDASTLRIAAESSLFFTPAQSAALRSHLPRPCEGTSAACPAQRPVLISIAYRP
ncbi:MAG: hypothetical protein JSS69_09245 [Acidobacteria bacterium]|nr:hypothetical protein [Acidobacteriota bacterium]MBS1866091.1 hypothetical protein [Acidobacteriota bacterium]